MQLCGMVFMSDGCAPNAGTSPGEYGAEKHLISSTPVPRLCVGGLLNWGAAVIVHQRPVKQTFPERTWCGRERSFIARKNFSWNSFRLDKAKGVRHS